jgi:hypothetical protein
MLSATNTGLLLNATSGIWKIPAAQQVIFGTTASTAVPDMAALAGYSVTSSLLDLSAVDASGQSSFDVLGAFYGTSSSFASLLEAYSAAVEAA